MTVKLPKRLERIREQRQRAGSLLNVDKDALEQIRNERRDKSPALSPTDGKKAPLLDRENSPLSPKIKTITEDDLSPVALKRMMTPSNVSSKSKEKADIAAGM